MDKHPRRLRTAMRRLVTRLPEVELVREGLRVHTRGLAEQGHPELGATVHDAALVPESEAFLRFIDRYLQRTGVRIKPSETLEYGYWLTKFHEGPDETLEVWEYDAEGSGFVPGVTLAVTYWRDQHEVCARVRVPFTPPYAHDLAAVSAGVLDSEPVQGQRMHMTEPMSGWMFTTRLWDGALESLTYHHLYHVTAQRPDLTPYVALPFGFCFSLAGGDEIWFDEEYAEKPEE